MNEACQSTESVGLTRREDVARGHNVDSHETRGSIEALQHDRIQRSSIKRDNELLAEADFCEQLERSDGYEGK